MRGTKTIEGRDELGSCGQGLRKRCCWSNGLRDWLALPHGNLALPAALAGGKRRTQRVAVRSPAARHLVLAAGGCTVSVRRRERERRNELGEKKDCERACQESDHARGHKDQYTAGWHVVKGIQPQALVQKDAR